MSTKLLNTTMWTFVTPVKKANLMAEKVEKPTLIMMSVVQGRRHASSWQEEITCLTHNGHHSGAGTGRFAGLETTEVNHNSYTDNYEFCNTASFFV